ncbi:MAG: hypothetical protein R3293_16860 [Candidatus Promineifilaceae bacterium]|nr:hypothetical protein [Candidatus Promineifilaceae bacterium]
MCDWPSICTCHTIPSENTSGFLDNLDHTAHDVYHGDDAIIVGDDQTYFFSSFLLTQLSFRGDLGIGRFGSGLQYGPFMNSALFGTKCRFKR